MYVPMTIYILCRNCGFSVWYVSIISICLHSINFTFFLSHYLLLPQLTQAGLLIQCQLLKKPSKRSQWLIQGRLPVSAVLFAVNYEWANSNFVSSHSRSLFHHLHKDVFELLLLRMIFMMIITIQISCYYFVFNSLWFNSQPLLLHSFDLHFAGN